MSQLSTHVLDTSLGKPAAGVAIRLEYQFAEDWEIIGEGVTDDDGRLKDLIAAPLQAGRYRLT